MSQILYLGRIQENRCRTFQCHARGQLGKPYCPLERFGESTYDPGDGKQVWVKPVPDGVSFAWRKRFQLANDFWDVVAHVLVSPPRPFSPRTTAMAHGTGAASDTPVSLPRPGNRVNSNLPALGFRRGHELADGIKHDPELGIIFLLQRDMLPGSDL